MQKKRKIIIIKLGICNSPRYEQNKQSVSSQSCLSYKESQKTVSKNKYHGKTKKNREIQLKI